MANTIRIKRRLAGGSAGAPSSLANAELAFNEQDDTLYYGKGDSGGNATSVVAIGGSGTFATKSYADGLVTNVAYKNQSNTFTASFTNTFAGTLDVTGTFQIGSATVTSSAAELNLIDGSVANTVVNSKAVIYGSAGEVAATTLSTSGNATVGGALTVTGNLTVNGTTTTVNSTTMTVDDPIITLGGDTAPASDDNKDRGVEFRYHNGTTAKVGFFGYDDSTGKFAFIPDATNTSEVFSGTLGTIDVGAVHINGSQIAASNLSNGTTGSGSVVLATSPTLVTPALGTPSSGTLTSCTGYTVGNLSGLGTGVATALAVNTGSAGAVVLFNGALGTPSSGTLTSCTGLPISTGVSGLGTGVATFLATPSSANLASAVTDETGSGSLVFATSPTLVTPTLGVASATSVNKVAITAPATSATLTIADGKTLTASNTLTFTGTDASSVAFGTGGTVAYTGGTLAQFASTTSSQLAGVISDETGSGALVFGTSPSLTTPALAGETFSTSAAVTAGTNAQGQGALTTDLNVITTASANPSGVTLPTATTGRRIIVVNKGANSINIYPATGAQIDALGSNTAISLAVNGVMEFNASSTTQWYSSFNSAVTGTGVTTFSAGTTGLTPSSASSGAITLGGTLAVANGGTGVTTSTGSGSNVLSTSPTLVTPTLGAASATSINGLTITSSTGTLTVANSKTFTVSNTLTFTGTDASSVAFGTGGTVAYLGAANAFTAANTFTNTTGTKFRPAATNDGINIVGRSGGTGTFEVTLQTATLSATRTLTLPDVTGTAVVDAANNAFTGANTFTNATGQTFRPAATQDGIIVQGRAGGTSTFAVTLATATLSANRTLTLPNETGTVVTTASVCTAIADCTLDGGTF